MRKHSWRHPVWLLVLVAGLIVPSWGPMSAEGPIYQPIERFGYDVAREQGKITDYDVLPLHGAWYSDWNASQSPLRPGGIEYVQMVRLKGGVAKLTTTQLGAIIDANPGSLWIIGNEPECINQDNSTPEQYAELYHDLHAFITARDSTARLAVGGVVQATPLRLAWLDRMLSHYQSTYGEPLPADVWTVHNLILQELEDGWGCGIPRGLSETTGRLYGVQDNDNMEIFRQHLVDFRIWMRDRGFKEKPLLVTEFGAIMARAYGYTPERINAFMTASFDYMMTARDPGIGYSADGDRLVQRWAWCSLNDQAWDPFTGLGTNGALFHSVTRQIEPEGINYRNYTDALLAGQACLTGRSGLQGRPARPDASYAITLTARLLPVGGGTVLTYTTRMDATGHFGFCRVPAGTYDIVVKGFNTLAVRLDGVTVASDNPIIDFGTLGAADANGDNCVGILDYSLLVHAFATRKGERNYDPRSDFNLDGVIDILDYSLLVRNFAGCGAN